MKVMMKTIQQALMLLLTTLAINRSDAGPIDYENDAEPRSFIVGFSPGMSPEDQEAFKGIVRNVAQSAGDGGRIQIFDALNNRRVVDKTIEKFRSERMLDRQIAPEMKKFDAYLERAVSVRTGTNNQIHAPRFFDLVAASVRGQTSASTVILFGSAFHDIDADGAAMEFGPGQVPSPGHVLATSAQSIYGCADRAGTLQNVSIHWCTMDSNATTLETRAVEEFYSWFASARGGTLGSFEVHPGVVVERAISGIADGVPTAEIDRTDTIIEIRDLRKPAPKPMPIPEPTPEPELKPEPTPEPVSVWSGSAALSRTPLLLFMVDGSGSMGESHDLIQNNMLKLVREGVDLCSEIKVSVTVFRDKDERHSVLAPTQIRNPINAGETDPGMQSLIDFLTEKSLYIPTGDTDRPHDWVSNMHGYPGLVDVKAAIGGIQKFVNETATEDAPVLIVYCSDTGPWESHGTTDIEPDERIVAAELLRDMKRLMEGRQHARLVAVNTGNPSHSLYKTESVEFIRGLAAAAGERGTYATEPVAILYAARDFFNDNK